MDNPVMSSPQRTTVALKAGKRMDLWIFKAIIQEHLDLDHGVRLQPSRLRKDSAQRHRREGDKRCAGQV